MKTSQLAAILCIICNLVAFAVLGYQLGFWAAVGVCLAIIGFDFTLMMREYRRKGE